ncbi:MAG: RHS repeat-associated core domain-containing protein, partial [Bacteroidota bacterium]
SANGQAVRKDYVGGIEYVTVGGTSTLEALYHAEGRAVPVFDINDGTTITDFTYEYSIRDHLGNNRVMISDINQDGELTIGGPNSELLQEQHYYPFGMSMEGNWIPQVGVENAYTYNGKELNNDFGLDWLDYGARWYDPSIGRWGQVDPLAEAMTPWSPYNYAFNNPIRFTDPDGMLPNDEVVMTHSVAITDDEGNVSWIHITLVFEYEENKGFKLVEVMDAVYDADFSVKATFSFDSEEGENGMYESEYTLTVTAIEGGGFDENLKSGSNTVTEGNENSNKLEVGPSWGKVDGQRKESNGKSETQGESNKRRDVDKPSERGARRRYCFTNRCENGIIYLEGKRDKRYDTRVPNTTKHTFYLNDSRETWAGWVMNFLSGVQGTIAIKDTKKP